MAGRLPQYLMTQMMSAPLTPNYLLLLRGSAVLPPPSSFESRDIYGKRWRHVQYLADRFLKRWVRECLPTLQLRQKWVQPKRNVKCGDLRLIADENTPSKRWPLERIIKTFPGKDGLVRSARVKTSWSVLTRSVDKLCLLKAVAG